MLVVGKFLGYHYTDDTAMTLVIANSLTRQPAAAVDVHKFDARDLANGYCLSYYQLVRILFSFQSSLKHVALP